VNGVANCLKNYCKVNDGKINLIVILQQCNYDKRWYLSIYLQKYKTNKVKRNNFARVSIRFTYGRKRAV